MPVTAVVPDGYQTQLVTRTVTDSVLYFVGTAGYAPWCAWNLDGASGLTTYDKVLAIGYLTGNNELQSHIGVSVDASPVGATAGNANNFYSGGPRSYLNTGSQSIKIDSGVYTVLGIDSTMSAYQKAASMFTGIAKYVENDVQKLYVRYGNGQWSLILSTADASFTGTPFKSVLFFNLAYNGLTARLATPFMVWGDPT
jgi:hypothetical protein